MARADEKSTSEKADLHWTYISGIERGQKNVSILNLYHIAVALEMRVRDLVKDF